MTMGHMIASLQPPRRALHPRRVLAWRRVCAGPPTRAVAADACPAEPRLAVRGKKKPGAGARGSLSPAGGAGVGGSVAVGRSGRVVAEVEVVERGVAVMGVEF